MKNDPIALAKRVKELELQLKECADSDADFETLLRMCLELRRVVLELEEVLSG